MEWTNERDKGRWFVFQNLAESLPVTNPHGLISDTKTLELGSESIIELPKTLKLDVLYRLEEVQPWMRINWVKLLIHNLSWLDEC